MPPQSESTARPRPGLVSMDPAEINADSPPMRRSSEQPRRVLGAGLAGESDHAGCPAHGHGHQLLDAGIRPPHVVEPTA